jgi:hypothetical protein
MKKNHIFIQCASYRDTELGNTVKSALDNAVNPERLSFGICWQGVMREFKEQLPLKKRQVRTVFIPHEDAKGIGYARHKAQLMFEDEEYSLQIDSHMRFQPRWDELSIDMLQSCPSNKPILSAYLTDWAHEEPACYRLRAKRVDKTGNVIIIGGETTTKEKEPQLGFLCSGHFLFASSEFFNQVPVDPNMQFLYEETLLGPRAWTNGWDIFAPHIAPLQHKWGRMYRQLNWDEQNLNELDLRCLKLYKQLVGIEGGFHNFGPCGMGNARTLKAYEHFSGINFKNRTVTKKAQNGRPTNPY